MFNDKVQNIKDRLTMKDVLLRYGYEPRRRMRCPLHNGDDFNFAVTDKTFMCFSHCGGGDVITFVQKLFSLSFPETLKKIDADFGLNLYGNQTLEEYRKAHYQTQKLKAERERKEAEKRIAEREYWEAFEEWKRLDENKKKHAPKSPEDELHPLFVEAIQKLPHQEYLLERAEEKRKLK